jgi:hypothetical protein
MLLLEGVKKSYTEPNGDTLPILDLPRFSVGAGEQMVLLGRSGSGKTTLLHIIAGITRPDAGTVRLDGVEMTKLSEPGRDRLRAAKLGYVFQTFNLLTGFNALENVLLGMTFARGRRDMGRAKELLERVGLTSVSTIQVSNVATWATKRGSILVPTVVPSCFRRVPWPWRASGFSRKGPRGGWAGEPPHIQRQAKSRNQHHTPPEPPSMEEPPISVNRPQPREQQVELNRCAVAFSLLLRGVSGSF